MKKNCVSLLMGLLLVFSVAGGAQAYTDLLAFGDSLSDNGYADGFGNGVYTNGKVWVEYMAEDLGVSLMDMAYGGAVSGQNNPYAYAMTGNALYEEATGLLWQVDTYINSVMGSADISGSLITMTAGGNDFFNYLANMEGTPYSPQSALDYAAGLYNPNVAARNVATAVGQLIAAGGDNFLIQNIAMANNPWADGFNYCLAAELAYLSATNADVNITVLDMTRFVPVVDYYTGTLLDDYADNPGTYAWYDIEGVHPTTQVHEQIADYALSQVNPVPEPASIMLLVTGLIGFAGVKRRKK